MKILICSDVHANFEALRMLSPYLKEVDLSICLGDIVGYGVEINKTIDFLRQNNFICIQGNHDRYLLEGTEKQTKYLNESVLFGIEIANRRITKDNLEWLKSLPISISYNLDGHKMLFVHGSPFDPTNEYVYPNNLDLEKFTLFHYDVMAMGHTHRVLLESLDNKLILNPGSIGQARDHEGKVCFMILETSTFSVETYQIHYDYNKHLQVMKELGADTWIYKHFQRINN